MDLGVEHGREAYSWIFPANLVGSFSKKNLFAK
jgi:hypothetical protein